MSGLILDIVTLIMTAIKKFVKRKNYPYYVLLTFTVITQPTVYNTNPVDEKLGRIKLTSTNK